MAGNRAVPRRQRRYLGGMERHLLVGTAEGLWESGPHGLGSIEAFAGRSVDAVARAESRRWAVVDQRSVWCSEADGAWKPVAALEADLVTCVAPTPAGLLVGTAGAHLYRLSEGRFERVKAFESVAGRDAWYTPWGDPADARSIACDVAGTIYVNVHVGGVVRSQDGGRTWTPTLDIDLDVHQVLAHPERPGTVFVAAAEGLGTTRDGGASWQFSTGGLHAHYLRAVAIGEGTVMVTASTGPSGRHAAVYRKPTDADAPFEASRVGLPDWFRGNIDTGCLAGAGSVFAFGTADGRIFQSRDVGVSWELVGKGLPEVRCLALG